MRKTALLTTIAAASIALAACSPSSKSATPVAAPVASVAATTAAPRAAGSNVVVKAANTDLGAILVDTGGRTLYGFTNDTDAKSTCSGTCAAAWPPVVVDADWTVAPGLDSGVFSTIKRDDGTEQLMAGKWPLYTFSGDASNGDLNGQGSGGVWFVVDTKATLTKTPANAAAAAAAAAPVSPTTVAAASGAGSGYGAATTKAPAAAPTTTAAPAKAAAVAAKAARSEFGALVVDAKGMTLYGFTKDVDGSSTCVAACANAWPPVLVSGDFAVEGLDKSLFTVIDRADGTKQLKMGKWPLYRFSGDAAAGDTNGQGSGGVWFVIGADAKLIK